MEHEPRQNAQGNGRHPQEQDVPRHEEAGVAARPEHALGEHRVHGLENDDEPNGVHQLPGDFLGFRRHLVIVDDGPPQQQDQPRREAAQQEAEAQEGVALALGFFQVALAHGVAGDDAAGIGDALGEHGGKLLHDGGHGVSRHKGFPDAAHHHGHGVVAQGQQAVADEHGNAHAEVFPGQVAALHADVPDPVGDLFVLEEEIAADEYQLKHPGDQRAQRGPGDFHARRAQMAEDEHPVEEDVDEEGEDGAEQRDFHLPHAAQHDGARQRQADAEIRGDQPAQVHHAVAYDVRFRGIDAHDHGRGDDGRQGKG